MPDLEKKIESVLFFRNEPITASELHKLLGASQLEIKDVLKNLQEFYKERGIVIVTDGENYSFGTHPYNSGLIEEIQKEEFSRELGRAGLETLAIILYRGPVSRRAIGHIRGVNCGYILRALMIRGLIERTDIEGERSYSYKPTLKLLEHLGTPRREELPDYETAFKKMEEFIKSGEPEEKND